MRYFEVNLTMLQRTKNCNISLYFFVFSYLAFKLGNKFGPVADGVLPTVIDLNANTATKVGYLVTPTRSNLN